MDLHQRGNLDRNLVNRRRVDSYHELRRDNGPSPADIGLQDAEACVRACYNQFVNEWYEKVKGGFDDVCTQLSHTQSHTDLWTLYCCDSTFCGVRIDREGLSRSLPLMRYIKIKSLN